MEIKLTSFERVETWTLQDVAGKVAIGRVDGPKAVLSEQGAGRLATCLRQTELVRRDEMGNWPNVWAIDGDPPGQGSIVLAEAGALFMAVSTVDGFYSGRYHWEGENPILRALADARIEPDPGWDKLTPRPRFEPVGVARSPRHFHVISKVEGDYDDVVWLGRAFPDYLCMAWQCREEMGFDEDGANEIVAALNAAKTFLKSADEEIRLNAKRVWTINASPTYEGSVCMAIAGQGLFFGIRNTGFDEEILTLDGVEAIERALDEAWSNRGHPQ